MKLAEHLRSVAEQLASSSDSARADAELIFAHALQCSRAGLFAKDEEEIGDSQATSIAALLARRIEGEPMAYLLGSQGFWNLEVQVCPDVLIPRPDTETIVEWCSEMLLSKPGRSQRLLDLGTGSGCIALALAKSFPNVQLVATDQSEAALRVARENARLNQITNIEFLEGNWFAALQTGSAHRRFDFVLSNPPYVAALDPHLDALQFEPRSALVSGDDGLDDLRKIIAGADRFLEDQGWLMVEHGFEQGAAVRALFRAAKYSSVETRCDLDRRERITAGCRQ